MGPEVDELRDHQDWIWKHGMDDVGVVESVVVCLLPESKI
jgi:hypothetical protein